MLMLRNQIGRLGGTYVLSDPSDYEPDETRRVDALARAAGKTVQEFIYDHYAQDDGSNYNVSLTLNYAQGSLDHVHALMQDPNTVSGLADGGAHMRLICDASSPTYALSFWARDRKRGPRLAIEHVVRRMTMDCARLYGLDDRGVLSVGKRADLNVIDHAAIGLEPPRVANDLPSGGARLLQDSRGYLATMVRGEVTRRQGEDTGARPGRLVRG
jgi:N-acyl-D-amino-acid deacylase